MTAPATPTTPIPVIGLPVTAIAEVKEAGFPHLVEALVILLKTTATK